MDSDYLGAAIAAGTSTYKIAKRTGKSQTTVRWWLKHFGISNTRADRKRILGQGKYGVCGSCGKQLPDNERNRSKCKSCHTSVRRLALKLACISILGGECVRCGWTGHIAAFEFHHKGGKSDKNFVIGRRADKAWELVRAELDKCELLCSNCHRIGHSKQEDPATVLAAANYRGMLSKYIV